jgi:hypothetical protein
MYITILINYSNIEALWYHVRFFLDWEFISTSLYFIYLVPCTVVFVLKSFTYSKTCSDLSNLFCLKFISIRKTLSIYRTRSVRTYYPNFDPCRHFFYVENWDISRRNWDRGQFSTRSMKRGYQILCTRRVSWITVIRYAQSKD